jgi:signal peptidase I
VSASPPAGRDADAPAPVSPDSYTPLDGRGDPRPPRLRRLAPRGGIVELLLTVLLALGTAWLFQAYVVKPYRIPSSSMEPTLFPGDRVLVSRFTYARGNPERGDVVVFFPPGRGDEIFAGAKTASDVHFIKRVIGLPGDTIEMRRGRVVVCVRPRVGCHVLNEPYARPTTDSFAPRLIPQGHYFMLGDNRDNSVDSRVWGTVPRSSIVGEAFTVYWPPRHAGLVD